MNTLRVVTVLGIFSFSLLAAGRASAFAESPMQALRRTNKTLNSLLRKSPKEGTPQQKLVQSRLKKTVGGLIDFEELARLSLGKHWDKRTPAERDEFVQILSDLIERNYVKQLKSNIDYTLDYRKEEVSGEKARVVTAVKVTRNGRTEEVTVEYKMRKTKRGWLAYDVITDDVSLVRNYRSQFNRIIRRDSYESLIKKMRRKLERI